MDPPPQPPKLLAFLGRQRRIQARSWAPALTLLLDPAAQQLRAHADILGHMRDRPVRIQHQSRCLSAVLRRIPLSLCHDDNPLAGQHDPLSQAATSGG